MSIEAEIETPTNRHERRVAAAAEHKVVHERTPPPPPPMSAEEANTAPTGNRHVRRAAAAIERKGWRVKDWSVAVGISKAATWQLLAEGKLRSVRFGSARIIVTPPEEFLASLDQA